jgi:hypothetical protein
VRISWLAGLVVAVVVLAGCGFAANGGSDPTAEITPQASLSSSLELCRNQLSSTLGAAGLSLVQPASAVRPAEAPLLAGAPRTVGQVLLPGDPNHGFIVIYEFPDPASAYGAAQQQATYIGNAEGRIQFLPDTKFTIRQYGSCVVFYDWAPSVSTDPRSPDIQTTLESFGVGIPVSS